MFNHYPIHDLIENQAKQLGLRRNELARRCGFKNVEKGLRRIDGVCHGDFDSPGAKMVIEALPGALEVDKNVVEDAIAATARIIAEAKRLGDAKRDAAWRETLMSANFDEWATRRVIRHYNLLRLQAGLSPIAMEEEIERIRVAKSKAKIEFLDFVYHSPLQQRVREKLLNRIRHRLKNPEWRPSGVLSGGGYAFYVAVNNRLRRIWRWRHRQDNP
jgi:hypothetical protein